jgi:hypothetical protein
LWHGRGAAHAGAPSRRVEPSIRGRRVFQMATDSFAERLRLRELLVVVRFEIWSDDVEISFVL